MIYLKDRFNFGKYRGMRVEDVADLDPGYIHWCAANTGHRFSNGVYIQVQRAHNRKPAYKAGGAFIRG